MVAFFKNHGVRLFFDAPFWLMAFIAVAVWAIRAPYKISFVGWQDILIYGLWHALLYRLLYEVIVCRCSPWKMALFWLGSPLLLFSLTWMRPVWAAVFTVFWAAALLWSVVQQAQCKNKQSFGGVAGYLILLAWVSLCGAGGYGFQSWDYQVHNGRLLDLMNFSWPVYYLGSEGANLLLVQYAGFYLWPALAGKLFGVSSAMVVQHLWLLMGGWLALRIMHVLTGLKHSWYIAASLIFFGGWSAVGFFLFAMGGLIANIPYETSMQIGVRELLLWIKMFLDVPGMPVWLSFWPATQVSPGIWFGNFISLASSMLWAPNQVIAGWLVVGLLCWSCNKKKVTVCLFPCALLVYYSPMIALGLLPAVLLLVVWQWLGNGWYRSDIFPMLSGVSVLCVLGAYYASVPIESQPYGFLLTSRFHLLPFILFVLQSWGGYAILVWLHRHWLSEAMQWFAVAVFFSATVVSVVYFGVNNDFMVRTSAALFYGILLVMAVIVNTLWSDGARRHAMLLVMLLLVSLPEGLLEVWQAVTHADVLIPGVSIVKYEEGWQFMGRQDSWFVRYLAADIHAQQ